PNRDVGRRQAENVTLIPKKAMFLLKPSKPHSIRLSDAFRFLTLRGTSPPGMSLHLNAFLRAVWPE
ncbi:MAG: hypothetical protein WC689_05860, partial [Methylocystis sp.]